MRLTNKYKLPEALGVAIHMDPYDSGDADVSVTGLMIPPRIQILREMYEDHVTVDVSERILPLLGTAFHKLMEHGDEPDVVVEQRLYAEYNGMRISGQIDRVKNTRKGPVIEDFKVTSVFSTMKQKLDWKIQLNLYRWLYYVNHGVWPSARIIALCRDYRTQERHRFSNYPESPIIAVEIESMSQREIFAMLEIFTSLRRDAYAAFRNDGTVPECSKQDRWYSEHVQKWAVFQNGTVITKTNLYDRAAKSASETGGTVISNVAANVRCANYCEVAKFCSQWTRIQEDAAIQEITSSLWGNENE